MRAVCGIPVKTKRVAFGLQQVVAVFKHSAVVEAGRGGTRQFKLVPCPQQAAVALAVVVEVGMRIVKSPVGDANQHPLASIGLWQSRTGMHAVGACVVAYAVQRREYRVGHAVLQYIGVGIQQRCLVWSETQGNHVACPRAYYNAL